MKTKVFLSLLLCFTGLFLSVNISLAAEFGSGLRLLYEAREGLLRDTNVPDNFLPQDRNEPYVTVQGIGDSGAVMRLGGSLRTSSGRYFTASIPVSRLAEFSSSDDIEWLDTGSRIEVCLDAARNYVRVNPVTEAGFGGAGVIVGFVDTGIDVNHPDFESVNGLSRILYIWDQNDASGNNPAGYNYGREWTKAQIDAGSCAVSDVVGHGTHVAGIAAGTGDVSGGVYSGMAPDANIIFVCYNPSTTAYVIDGIAYILQKSVELGRPCVINLSLGYQAGNHRADDPFNASIDSLLDTYGSQGHIIVWAMGNEGDAGIHYTNNLTPVNDLAVRISMDVTPMYAIFFYDSNQTVPVALVDPSGNTNIAFTTETIAYGTGSMIQNGVYPTGENYVVVKVNSTTHGIWKVVFKDINQTIFINGYIYDNSYGENKFVSAALLGSLSSSAAQSRAIAVGAITTKTNFINYESVHYYTTAVIEDIADFSGRGPSRDSQNKPDISAPGALVVSVRSSDAPKGYLDVNDYYTVLQGTSMAAPVVTGLIALMLEKEPALTVDEVRSRLIAGVRGNVYKTDPGTWDEAFGYGIADASFILSSDAATPAFDSSVYNNIVDFSSDTDNRFVLRFTSNSSQVNRNIAVSIIDTSGNLIKDFGIEPINGIEVKEYVWDGSDRFFRTVPAGIYFAVVQIGDTVERYPVLVVR